MIDMFKKLRNKLLILNLSIIFILMMVSFSSIYFITYNDIHKSVQMELHRISEFGNKSKDTLPKPSPNNSLPILHPNEIIPERTVSFVLTVTSDWRLINAISFFNMDVDFFDDAMNTVKESDQETGSFELDSNNWGYLITPFDEGYRIVFLDITTQQNVLTNMIFTFSIVALITLVFIFLISLYLTNKSIQPVKDAFEKQKQFIADASHELKTPLAVINTNVDVILSNQDQTVNSQTKWLGYIKTEIDRMSKLTSDLLYLTQMDHSEIHLLMSDFNFSNVVENVLLTMEAVIYEEKLNLDYEIEPNLILHGNQEQLTQVVMILLDNAIKYSPEKGIITLNMKRLNNNVVLSLTNTGDGINSNQIDKIFDRFYRTDSSRSRKNGGYGLGLAIAKTIVEQHDGKIYVESVTKEFTTFTIKVPIKSLKENL